MAKNEKTGKKTPKTKELKDSDLDKASGGFQATDDLWVKGQPQGFTATDDLWVKGKADPAPKTGGK